MYYRNTIQPFRDYELRNVIINRDNELRKRVELFTDEEILANDENILADNLFEEYRFIPVEIQDEDVTKRKMTQQKIKVPNQFAVFQDEPKFFEVDGICIDISIPYVGEAVLFQCRASTISLSPYPEIILNDGYIGLHFEFKIKKGSEKMIYSQLCSQRDDAIKRLCSGIALANRDIEAYNTGLREKTLSLIKAKKEKVSSFHVLSELLAIPIQQNDFAKTHIPVKRRIQPISHSYNRDIEYTISGEDYKDILQAIKHIGSSIEQTPATYKSMGEEDLRNVLIGQLNALYVGQATGETFRKSGKTDIRIEKDNRAAFVAECKLWNGPKEIEEAIDQMDHYLTWRDCKTALIFFVRRTNFISILDTAKANLTSQSNMCCVKEIDKNEFECTYKSQATPGQIIKIRCFFFNVEAGRSKR